MVNMVSTNSIWAKVQRRLLFAFARYLPDRWYLERLFPLMVGYSLNLDHPMTFNEKLQWLKLYDRKPEYSKMVDKIEAKKYVAAIIGEEHIIPTLAVYDSVEDIVFDDLPEQFVLKCSHDSGTGLVICKDKETLDKGAVLRKLKKALKINYFFRNREWPYKSLKPRILAEAYIEDGHDRELRDYKFFCFNGKPQRMLLATGRNDMERGLCLDFFDMDFNHLDLADEGHSNAKSIPHKPLHFDEMKQLAVKLSAGIPQVRVDFYEANNVVLFGELTFFDMGGYRRIRPNSWDLEWGKMIKLPTI